MWTYNGEEFTSDMIEDYVGFVYIVTMKNTGKKYLGKKLFMSTRRLAPLKGKTRKRKVVKPRGDFVVSVFIRHIIIPQISSVIVDCSPLSLY